MGRFDNMELSDRQYMEVLSTKLKFADRLGGEVDDPEGTRFLRISDTLALEISARLAEIADRL